MAKLFRAGDVVKHKPSGEMWTLACDQDGRDVLPAGWPECLARPDECVLVEAATDTARREMLEAAGKGRGYRASVARRQLIAEDTRVVGQSK